jgi:hypothetical protein
MDQLEHYRNCIQALLERHSQFKSETQSIKNLLCFDSIRDLTDTSPRGLGKQLLDDK